MCCASRTIWTSASPPDHVVLVSRSLASCSSSRTGPRRKWRGFCFLGGLNHAIPCSDPAIVPFFAREESASGGTLSHQGGRYRMILQSLAGLPAFLVYFCTAIVAVVAYLFVYTRITPHNEFQLIRDNDPAA